MRVLVLIGLTMLEMSTERISFPFFPFPATLENSRPLSACKICGGPIVEKMERSATATAPTVLCVSGALSYNLVPWSW